MMMVKMNKVENKIIEDSVIALKNVKNKIPITNCITNYITINDCANAILGIGGSPIMGDNEEIKDFLEIFDALVINMGAMAKTQIEAIKIGTTYGAKNDIPIVLDPVGVGISKLRNHILLDLINKSKLSVIRGNMSEIKYISRLVDLDEIKSSNKSQSKGVDVSKYDEIRKESLNTNGKIVKSLARDINTVIIASGVIDIISDGKNTYVCENGDPMLPKIVGSGCMLTSIVGSFCGANDPLIGGIAATITMGVAGGEAGKIVREKNSGTGTFRVKLIDFLSKMNETLFLKEAKLYKIKI